MYYNQEQRSVQEYTANIYIYIHVSSSSTRSKLPLNEVTFMPLKALFVYQSVVWKLFGTGYLPEISDRSDTIRTKTIYINKNKRNQCNIKQKKKPIDIEFLPCGSLQWPSLRLRLFPMCEQMLELTALNIVLVNKWNFEVLMTGRAKKWFLLICITTYMYMYLYVSSS